MGQALSGRTAVVTGASRGIGSAIARSLAQAGARVALLARSADPLAAVAAEIGQGALALDADLTAETAVKVAADRIREEFGGPPDILVNNAGIFRAASADTLSVAAFVDSIEINLVAQFCVIRAFLPAMLARGSGHIVTLGSVADRSPFPGNAAYAASKFGLRGLHEVIRLELRGSGVRATLVSPGSVDTDLWNEVERTSPPGRFPARSEMLPAAAVADAVLFCVTRPPAVNVEELRLRHT